MNAQDEAVRRAARAFVEIFGPVLRRLVEFRAEQLAGRVAFDEVPPDPEVRALSELLAAVSYLDRSGGDA